MQPGQSGPLGGSRPSPGMKEVWQSGQLGGSRSSPGMMCGSVEVRSLQGSGQRLL